MHGTDQSNRAYFTKITELQAPTNEYPFLHAKRNKTHLLICEGHTFRRACLDRPRSPSCQSCAGEWRPLLPLAAAAIAPRELQEL